jgi:signal transduction histidine kinase
MRNLKFEYKITAIYSILGGLWILFSDKLLNYFIQDINLSTKIQTYKGWFYVIVTALLFYSVLKKHLVKIRDAEQKALESDRLKTVFLQNISHEIRTPMNGIVGFAGLLTDKNLSVEQKDQYLEIIIKSSNRLLKIVNDVVEISVIQSGNSTADIDNVDLNLLLDDIYNSNKPLINEHISFTLKKGLDNSFCIIVTDPDKLKQVITNLLSNAIKFTDSGKIEFGYVLNKNELEFFISDTGIGIASDSYDKIFEPFYKTEKKMSRLYEGVGLGLAICKGNIDLLKGRIRVKSEPNRGSTFFFSIPYIQVKHIEAGKLK